MFDGIYLYKEIFFSRIFLVDLKVGEDQFKKKLRIFILMLRSVYGLKYGFNAYLSIY